MAGPFASNPLSLSVPDPSFESWLRDSGFLPLLDHRTSLLHHHHHHSSTTPATAPATTISPSTASTATTPTTTTSTTTLTTFVYVLFMSLLSRVTTLLSLLSLNPFAKLTSADFNAHNSAPWTSDGFWGSLDSYSFPSSPTQAKMRVHENVKRFARNYAALLIVFFACCLYQMPLALAGLLACLGVWELFRFCEERWKLNDYPATRQVLIHAGQCVVAVILFCCNIQMAVFCALAVAYGVMMLHASFRKLTPAKQPPKSRGR